MKRIKMILGGLFFFIFINGCPTREGRFINLQAPLVFAGSSNDDLIVDPPQPEEKFKTLLLLQESKGNIFKYYFYVNDYEIRRALSPAQSFFDGAGKIVAEVPTRYNYFLVIKGRYQAFWTLNSEWRTGKNLEIVEIRQPGRSFFIGYQEGERGKFVPNYEIFLEVPAPSPVKAEILPRSEKVKNFKPRPGRLSIKIKQ